MFNVLRNNDSATTLVCQGVRLVLIRRVNELSYWKDCDGVIIDTAIITEVETIIKTIRLNENIESLTPLFVNNIHQYSKEIMSHTDGFVDVQQPEQIVHKTIAINKRLAEITAPSVSNFETQVTYKITAFLYSRNHVFSPFVSRASRIGYHFPLLSLYFNNEALNLLKTLEKLEHKAYVVKTFKDNIHLCKSCDSTYLNFKEICTSCKSADIQARDMIHHFVCAHVAQENDFITEDGLSCPKCDKHLRHIGIDYDKPSAIFACNSCANEFQNPEMQASCFDCETDNMLSELLQKTIGNYSITAKGEQWLRNKHMPNQKQIANTALTSETGLPIPIFKILLKQELKRVQKSGVSSQFVTITYENEQLEALNTTMQTALENEITTIIQSYLASSDVLTVQNYKLYYALLPDTKKAPERVEQIRYNLSKLLTDNLDTGHFLVTVTTQNLESEMEIDTLFIPKKES